MRGILSEILHSQYVLFMIACVPMCLYHPHKMRHTLLTYALKLSWNNINVLIWIIVKIIIKWMCFQTYLKIVRLFSSSFPGLSCPAGQQYIPQARCQKLPGCRKSLSGVCNQQQAGACAILLHQLGIDIVTMFSDLNTCSRIISNSRSIL